MLLSIKIAHKVNYTIHIFTCPYVPVVDSWYLRGRGEKVRRAPPAPSCDIFFHLLSTVWTSKTACLQSFFKHRGTPSETASAVYWLIQYFSDYRNQFLFLFIINLIADKLYLKIHHFSSDAVCRVTSI